LKIYKTSEKSIKYIIKVEIRRLKNKLLNIFLALQQAQALLDKVDRESTSYSQKISADPKEQFSLKGDPLEEVLLQIPRWSHHVRQRFRQDIRIRIATALSAISSLHGTWSKRRVSIHTKMKLYKALILPTAPYG